MPSTKTPTIPEAIPPLPEKWHSGFRFILPVLLRPARGLKEIATREKAFWLVPLLVLSLAALLSVLVAGPIRGQLSQGGGALPPDFQYYTPEQQQQFTQAQQTSSSPLFTYVFPATGLLAGIWLSWALLGGMLYLGLTLAGSRSSSVKALNLAGWAGLPFAVRYLLQAGYILFTRNLISAQGISGFSPPGSFLSALLSQVDIYLVWQVVLLFIGVPLIASITRRKAWLVTAVVLVLLLCLASLPAFAVSKLGGVGPVQPFFF
jgi:hypothetical protein